MAGQRSDGAPRSTEPSVEPDYRMSLASERTYLAYTRTSLALIAAGVAVIGVLSDGHVGLRRTIAVILVALGAVLAFGARVRWQQVDRAMRRGDPLPAPSSDRSSSARCWSSQPCRSSWCSCSDRAQRHRTRAGQETSRRRVVAAAKALITRA